MTSTSSKFPSEESSKAIPLGSFSGKEAMTQKLLLPSSTTGSSRQLLSSRLDKSVPQTPASDGGGETAQDVEEDCLPSHYEEVQVLISQQYEEYLDREHIFNKLFAELPLEVGKEISSKARNTSKISSSTLSYGEIIYDQFGLLLISLQQLDIDINKLTKFVDIGSGTGKGVLCASLLYNFEHCVGIEILEELSAVSSQITRRYLKQHEDPDAPLELQILHGDATFMDWSAQADVVFAHATAFDPAMMSRLAATANKMKPNSIFISLTHRLPSDEYFELISVKPMRVSWGEATVFIHRRKTALAVPNDMANRNPKTLLAEVLNCDIPV